MQCLFSGYLCKLGRQHCLCAVCRGEVPARFERHRVSVMPGGFRSAPAGPLRLLALLGGVCPARCGVRRLHAVSTGQLCGLHWTERLPAMPHRHILSSIGHQCLPSLSLWVCGQCNRQHRLHRLSTRTIRRHHSHWRNGVLDCTCGHLHFVRCVQRAPELLCWHLPARPGPVLVPLVRSGLLQPVRRLDSLPRNPPRKLRQLCRSHSSPCMRRGLLYERNGTDLLHDLPRWHIFYQRILRQRCGVRACSERELHCFYGILRPGILSPRLLCGGRGGYVLRGIVLWVFFYFLNCSVAIC